MTTGLLVLCESHDVSALWAARGLAKRVDGPVDIVTGAMLGSARTWEHRIRGDVAEVEITLMDGRRISGAQPRPVLNRLSYAPGERMRAVGGADGDYAVQEFQALFLSWLAALPGPMLNRPSPQFLAGRWRIPAAWAVLAAQAGLETAPLRRGAVDPAEQYADNGHQSTVFVVAQRVVASSEVPVSVLDGCRRLGALAGDDLLGIRLAATDGWRFVGATPLPDLTTGGDALLDALAATLVGAP